jgi:hypothetical protein
MGSTVPSGCPLRLRRIAGSGRRRIGESSDAAP